MPSQLRFSSATVDTQTDAVCSLLDDGYFQLWDGKQPKDGDSPPDGVLLAELRFGSPAFAPSTDGVAWANPLTMATAMSTGRARWMRALRSDHISVVFDGDVGTGDAVLNLDRVSVQANANVIITDFSYVSPKV